MGKGTHLGLLLMLLAIIGFFFLLRPQIKRFGQLALDAKAKAVVEKSYKNRIEQLDIIKGQSSIQTVLNNRFVALPRDSQIPEVLVMIENLGSSSGVSFTNATVGKPTANEVPVSLGFSGSLSTVTSFEDNLFNNIRTISVKNQSITADAAGNLNVTMQLGLIFQGSSQ